MQLNEVHGQVKKGNKKHMTMESNGFHNHYTLITRYLFFPLRLGGLQYNFINLHTYLFREFVT